MFALTRRAGPRTRRRGRAPDAALSPAVAGSQTLSAPAAAPVTWRPRPTRPSALRSVVAETILTWRAASWLKWPLLLASLAALVAPGDSGSGVIAVFLLLLAPPVAEVAAREELAGTASFALVQPGVPRSVVGWKMAAVALFVLIASAPVVAASFARSPEHGATMMLALLFIAASAVGLGYVTGGGKLFLGAYTALWYVAMQRDSPLDFVGALSAPNLERSATFAGAGLLALAAAFAVERLRARR
jgi:hypothetical protein